MRKSLDLKSSLFSAYITRKWAELPDDARVSTTILMQVTGANQKTIHRHATAGLLASAQSVTKREAERWLQMIERRGGLKPGRPRKVKPS